MSSTRFRINEMFETIQGEGVFTGVPAVFIRLQICNVGCSWCDTKQTWEAKNEDQRSFGEIISKQGDSPTWSDVDAAEIVAMYQSQQFNAKHIVITGGEPCEYDLTALCDAFEAIGCRCQIETSGTSEIRVTPATWVTVSPKVAMKGKLPVLPSSLERADEIKHPVATQKNVDQLDELLQGVKLKGDVVIELQPISQKPRATELCIETCIQRNYTHRQV